MNAAPAADRPNILFLFADDQRADTIATLGNPVIKTPNLDRLARSGLAFNRAHMQGGMQGATSWTGRKYPAGQSFPPLPPANRGPPPMAERNRRLMPYQSLPSGGTAGAGGERTPAVHSQRTI